MVRDRVELRRQSVFARNAEFRSRRFKLVLARLLLNNLGFAERLRLVRLAARVTQPGGIFLLCTHADDQLSPPLREVIREGFRVCGPSLDAPIAYASLTTEALNRSTLSAGVVAVGYVPVVTHVLRRMPGSVGLRPSQKPRSRRTA